MAERYDALSAREYTTQSGETKSAFTKIGAAFPNRDGKGFTVLLDAVPASNEGQYKIMLREPLPKDGQRQQSGGSYSESPNDDLDDDTPF